MKYYGYIRVSTDRQKTENQRFEIENYCRKNGIKIDEWIAEKISGKIGTDQRKLGKLLRKISKNDTIICSEISRLSREMYALIAILYQCERKVVNIISIKENFNPREYKYAKYFALFFAATAEMEREMISQRTKEALARLRSEGKMLGRPFGSKSRYKKLSGKEELILKMKSEGISLRKMTKKLDVSTKTLWVFIKENNL